MSFTDDLVSFLTAQGITFEVEGETLTFPGAGGRPMKLIAEGETDWNAAQGKYSSLRNKNFDADGFYSIVNNSVEFRVGYLSSAVGSQLEDLTLCDKFGNSVIIGRSSDNYCLGFFYSPKYKEYFDDRIKHRLLDSGVSRRRYDILFPRFFTARYIAKGRRVSDTLVEDARKAIQRALFKVAVDYGVAISLTKKQSKILIPTQKDFSQTTLPSRDYNADAVSYYKIGLSSPFQSQSFLSYYHVLEYFFLSTQESILSDRLVALISDTSFSGRRRDVDRIISTVRGQDAKADETEMLRSVIEKYVDEDELISFIKKFELDSGSSLYTKQRKVFGESFSIQDKRGHAISNAAKLLKHVRNAIVHSSDRYKREDCHIPLSDTEFIIGDYIPILKFIAEKVIFGTAD